MSGAEYTAAADGGACGGFVKDSAGCGFARWTSRPRKQGLPEFARASGKSSGNLRKRPDVLRKELQGNTSFLNTLKTAAAVKAASGAVLTGCGWPAGRGDAVKKRAGYGRRDQGRYADAKPVRTDTGCTAAKVPARPPGRPAAGRMPPGAFPEDRTANAGSANRAGAARIFVRKPPDGTAGRPALRA